MKQYTFETQVEDKDAKAVLSALADESWDYRSIQGISRSTGIEASRVELILKNNKEFVRVFPAKDSRGRILYTLSERPENLMTILPKIKTYLGNAPLRL